MKNKLLLIIFSYLIVSCSTDWEKQSKFLLPEQNQLKLISKEETIMATINQYSINGKISQEGLNSYPINQLKKKKIKKWHKATQQEIRDIQQFFTEEPINEDIGKDILIELKKGEGHLAYMYSFNESAPTLEDGLAHKNREPLPGEKGYITSNWIDIYYLNEQNTELIHISYGKF